MSYILRGRLSALSCEDCPSAIGGATVRLYAAVTDQTLAHRASADPRHTFRIFHHEDADAPARGELLGEGVLDEAGNYQVELGQSYDGGALDVDLYCGTVGGHVPPRPRQVAITTIQPQWRAAGGEEAATDANVAAFNYEIPPRLWCAVLAQLGLWVICGRVTICDSDNEVVPDVTVSAFDRDWLQDDPLGSAVTDGSGRFEIWYTTPDFTRTPFSPLINIELVPGPDVYFRIVSPGGATLLAEPPSEGRAPGRQNVGPCFCIDLCVSSRPPQNEPIPDFRYIGGIDYETAVDSASGGTGLTIGDSRAFYNGLRLNGPIGTTLGGQPLEYRFEVRALPSGSWTPVVGPQILPTVIGTWEKLTGAILTVEQMVVAPGVPPSTTVVNPAPDGWIAMPQDNDLLTTGLFTPNLDMIRLDTTAITSWPPIDVGGINAGHTTTPAGLANDQLFGIRMRVRQVGNPASETDGGTCNTLAIDNTLYNHVNKGGSWAPSQVSGQYVVASVDIQELISQGCAGIGNQLTVLFTAAHPNLGPVSVEMTGPGGPYSFTLPAASGGQQFGTATPNFTVSSLQKCAYIVTLSVTPLLTTGDTAPLPEYDQIAFCKS